jgi:sec-independent protein translocase protein TatB
MFDIGFTELLLLACVGLLVIGPEKLPHFLRESGRWYTHVKIKFQDIKSEIEDEIGVEEIKEQLRSEEIMGQLKKDKEKLDELDQSMQSTNVDFLESLTNPKP